MSGVLGGLIGSLKAGAPPVTFSTGTIMVNSLFYTTAIYAPVTNGNYFAFGGPTASSSTTTYYYSSNGTSWTSGNLPNNTNSRSSAFNGSVLVVGTGQINGYFSLNGTTWTSTSMGGSIAKTEGLWNGSRFVFSGLSPTISIIYSTDAEGTSWSSYANISTTGLGFNGSNTYIAVNAGTSTARINTTDITSAAAWSNLTLPDTQNWTSVKHNGSIWIIAAGGSTSYMTSTDGTTWTNRTLPVAMSGASATSVRPKMAVLNGEFYYFGVSGANKVIYSSSDGIDWTLEFSGTSNLSIAQGWAVGGGKIIAVGLTTSSTGTNVIVIGTY